MGSLITLIDPGGLTSILVEWLLDRRDRGRSAREAAEWSGGAPSFSSPDESRSDDWDVGGRTSRAPRRSGGVGRRAPLRITIVALAGVAAAALVVVLIGPWTDGADDSPIVAAAPETPAATSPDAPTGPPTDAVPTTPEPAPPSVVESPGSTDGQAPVPEAPADAPVPAPEATEEVDLFDPPRDRAAFFARVRADTVSILCYRGSAQGSGWPLDIASLGVAEAQPGTLIITNGHVTEGCSRVTVQHGDRQYDGSVVGTDFIDSGFENDFAIVRVSETIPGFPAATSFTVGQWVLAAGSPSGVEQTVTSGIVSNDLDGLIWTDTTISPGSSGGPLINSRGEVIGVVTWGLIGDSGVDPDLGMAIPVQRLCDRLLTCSGATG